MKECISIVIPVFNHREALIDSLRSIAEQSYPALEVIVVDDGSARRIAEEDIVPYLGDIPFTLLHQENKGAPAARNVGAAHAHGAYIIFWDADVTAVPEMLEKMQHVLVLHPEAAYVYSSFLFGTKKMTGRTFDADVLQQQNYIHSTSLIRSEAAIPWDERLLRFQDWDVWLSLAEQGSRGIWIPEFLFTVTPRKKGMSTWLPACAYHIPFKYIPGIRNKVRAYERARQVVWEKHGIVRS